MNFDEIINRKNTHSAKWDMMEELYGVSKENGIPMWVADMDFRPPKIVQDLFLECMIMAFMDILAMTKII